MQAPSAINRIVLYVRVSSEEQREGQTIDSQIAELERSAKERSWVLVDTYKDEGWSGGMLARPALDRLRDDASKGRFDAVLVNDVDRLARDVAHLGVIKRDLERKGVQIIFRKLPPENSPLNNLMVNILGSFAEFEKELITDRTRRGRRHKVEVRHLFIGCIPPYGLQYVRKIRTKESQEEGKLRVNPEEAAVARLMFQWVDEEALSAHGVVRRLNEMGIRPRKGASRWAKSSVLRILRSEVYAGIWYYNKYESCEPANGSRNNKYRKHLKSSMRWRPKTDWLPLSLPEELRLVSRDQWERVQDRLTQNIAFSPRNSKHVYLLRSLVRCAGCGFRFVGDPNHHKFYYRCSERCKKVPTVKEEALDSAVWSALEEAILNPDLVVENISKLQEQDRGKADEVAVSEVEKATEQLRVEESRILEAYRLQIITSEQLSREMQKLDARRASLGALQSKIPNERRKPLLSKEKIGELVTEFCKQIVERLASMVQEERQQLLRLIVREVTFDGATATIRGIIPFKANEHIDDSVSSGEIATTEPSSLCHPPAILLNIRPIRTQTFVKTYRVSTKPNTESIAAMRSARRHLLRSSGGAPTSMQTQMM